MAKVVDFYSAGKAVEEGEATAVYICREDDGLYFIVFDDPHERWLFDQLREELKGNTPYWETIANQLDQLVGGNEEYLFLDWAELVFEDGKWLKDLEDLEAEESAKIEASDRLVFDPDEQVFCYRTE